MSQAKTTATSQMPPIHTRLCHIVATALLENNKGPLGAGANKDPLRIRNSDCLFSKSPVKHTWLADEASPLPEYLYSPAPWARWAAKFSDQIVCLIRTSASLRRGQFR